MRALLIVNATASSVTARARVVIHKALAADFDVTLAETTRRGHAERLARGAAHDGADVVVVLGGDGTLNEAANGLAGSDTALAPLPGGSTNVFARTIGVSKDPMEATGQLLASLHRRSYRRIGLGAVNGRRFLFHAGLGFDAAVVAQVEKRSELKRYAGHPLFVASAFLTWFRHYDHSRPRFSVEIPGVGGVPATDGEVVPGCYFAIVSKTSPYTYLGPRPVVVAPEASLDTALSLTAFRTLRFTPVMGAVVSAVTSTSGVAVRRNPRIVGRAGLERFSVVGPEPFPYQVDGDHLGEVERLDFIYEPASLILVVP
ncbi:MAG: diacylglycerol kinase family lipid kinase [Actinomycetota bacterium]|nr:diacylglycerol kinase family lipid kinase [Actinomycetota bacterium]